ncbi:ribosome silencing factor [Limnohabitans sp. JirII-29]|jgi:ribosome-associated protein|uniref:ribosome silencing factor n=1 Tax=Limnohabitans sp. JirII-29 TaxID=1835756 RepID=UPI000D3C454B|nr:ribosome silencing factor [Limnohabitans sp. JirII-29]PUE28245.1 ribosome silencing factor [Limnohabitans sp. JirII-29]
MTESTAKKDVQKLQRCIVDALEDVKAQGLAVFDTEHLSSLFERVIIASGTSNRQTKALAASVRDKVREAGFPKPRIEGEDNGEWIIVDCGAAVVHVMQPNIRQYYNLEEIWGEKPVRLKFGAPKPAAPVVEPKVIAKKPAAKKTPAKKTTAKKVGASQSVATKTASKSSTKPVSKPVTKVVGKPVARKTTAKPVAKKSAAKKTVARKA